MLGAVVDANVYASALVKPGGPPDRILEHFLADRSFELVLSASILAELRECLAYPKLRKYRIPMTITSLLLRSKEELPTSSRATGTSSP